MRLQHLFLACLVILCCLEALHAESEFQKVYKDRHQQGSSDNFDEQTLNYTDAVALNTDLQDELSADIQELTQQETSEKVIDYLNEAESLMAQATDMLEQQITGDETIAIENEIIEKLYGAAKAKSQGPGKSKEQSEALLQMMQRMMEGAFEEKDEAGNNQQETKNAGGEGQQSQGSAEPNVETKTQKRRVIKKSGSALTDLPREFQPLFEQYNREMKK